MTLHEDAALVLPLILTLRDRRVILDSDLARLYGVSTKRLNEQVRRNPNRFPVDFAFRLDDEEARSLRSQNATSKKGRGGRRYLPLAFTEYGTVMAANVLNSERAVEMSVTVVRAFIRLRVAALSGSIAERKLEELDRAVNARLEQHDKALGELFEAVKSLILPPEAPNRKRIGFVP